MNKIKATVAEIDRKKSAMEQSMKDLVRQFEEETGLFVAGLSLDRYRRGLGHRQPPYRVEAVVQFWPKHTMEDIEYDRTLRRLKEQSRRKQGPKEGE